MSQLWTSAWRWYQTKRASRNRRLILHRIGTPRSKKHFGESVAHFTNRSAKRLYEQAHKQWLKAYDAYLKSPEWKRKSELVIKRAKQLCEGCLTRKAIQVHHLSYEHVGEEFLFELVAVCTVCHERLHQDSNVENLFDPLLWDSTLTHNHTPEEGGCRSLRV